MAPAQNGFHVAVFAVDDIRPRTGTGRSLFGSARFYLPGNRLRVLAPTLGCIQSQTRPRAVVAPLGALRAEALVRRKQRRIRRIGAPMADRSSRRLMAPGHRQIARGVWLMARRDSLPGLFHQPFAMPNLSFNPLISDIYSSDQP